MNINNDIFIIMTLLVITVFISLAIRLIYSKKAYEYFTTTDTYPPITQLSVCRNSDSDYNDTTRCFDVSNVDFNNNIIPRQKMRIDNSHYIDSLGVVRGTPYGYISSADKRQIILNPNMNSAMYSRNALDNTTTGTDKSRIQILREGSQGIISICNVYNKDYSSCYDLSYVDSTNSIKSGVKARVKNNYYIDASGMIVMAPQGASVSSNKRSYSFSTVTTTSTDNDLTRAYNGTNLDITYHADPTQSTNADNIESSAGKMWIMTPEGTLKQVPFTDISDNITYYEPGSYPFGPSSYVPVYEESVYLSKLTNQPTITPYTESSSKRGFCQEFKNSKYEIETKCNTLDKNICASTACCVLLGGSKCVAGNSSGPAIKANYSDFMIMNRDYYHYKGKCYGNCPM